jgi:hypothetical protein
MNFKWLYFSIIFLLISVKPTHAAVIRQKTTVNRYNLSPEMSVRVSAKVGGYLFDLKGLTSPWAKVEFYSTEGNIKATTLANNDGIFYFKNVLTPMQTGDFCFLSYDTNGTANNPLCFSPPPPKTKTVIDDIVLSPTIYLNKGVFRQGESIEASGRTFPNAEIRIYMFEENRPFWVDLIDVVIPKAFARTGPQLTITADSKGNFSYNLPTQKSNLWRMFAGPRYKEENMTAKSNVLEFSALSWWQWILLKLLLILNLVQKKLFSILLKWETLYGLLTLGIVTILVKNSKFKVQN